MRVIASLALVLLITACSAPADKLAKDRRFAGAHRSPIAERSDIALADTAAAPAEAAPPLRHAAAPVPGAVPMLAYAYGYGVAAQPSAIRTLIARHEAACVAAGPATCQITGSVLREDDAGGARGLSGQLQLRAEPAWLKRFRDDLAGGARALGGRLVTSTVTSEDLSQEIVDTTALLKAKTTLRDRLQTLLASHPGKLSDLLQVEQSLSRVQGEIDQTTSELAMMQARVATSQITIDYSSEGLVTARGVWAPMGKAFEDFLGIMAETLANMIRLVAWALPWALILGGLVWLFRKRLPKPRWPFRKRSPPSAA